MTKEQETAAAAAASSGSQQSHSDSEDHKPQPAASLYQNNTDDVATTATGETQHAGFDVDQFLEHSPWLVLPGEMSTGTKVDEASGKSYLFLHNAPVNNYVALDINDGHEFAAGGDREYLVEYLRAHLNDAERYHVVVIPEKNVQMAEVPRWQLSADWLDYEVLQNNPDGNNNNDEEEVQEEQSPGVAIKIESTEKEGECPSPEPPLSSFLPQMIFAESPPQQHRSPSEQEHVRPQGDHLPQDVTRDQPQGDHLQQEVSPVHHLQDRLQEDLPRVQPVDRAPHTTQLRTFSDSELNLFHEFLDFSLARLEKQRHAAEPPTFFPEEEQVFRRVNHFLHEQNQLRQNASARRSCCRCGVDLHRVDNHFSSHHSANAASGNRSRLFGRASSYGQNNMSEQAAPLFNQRLCESRVADFIEAATNSFFARLRRDRMPPSPLPSWYPNGPLHHNHNAF